MPPYLAEVLDDPYSGVRFIAGRSLRRIPGFEDFDYDYVAPVRALADARAKVQARWRRMHPIETFQDRTDLFFDSDGEVDVKAVIDVLRRRDKRPVFISE